MKALLPDAVARRFDPAGRFGLRLTLFALALLLVAVPFTFLTLQVLTEGPLVRADRSVADHLHGYATRSGGLVAVLEVISFAGKPVWLWGVVGAAVLFLVRRGQYRLAVFLVASGIGGGVVDTVLKVAVDRPRPELEDPVAVAFGKSFPSGHAMMSLVVYGGLLLVFLPVIQRRWRTTVVACVGALILAIGLSRLALGVHFVSDVLGGWVMGLAWLVASVAAFSIWRQERGRDPVEPLEGLEPEAAADLSASA
jgi:membrane-associated phospholipid phosphatase